MAAPVFLNSGPPRCEAGIHSCGTNMICFFHAIATIFQLYHGTDMVWDEKEKTQAYILMNQGIFNTPHHIGMVWEELAFDDTVIYRQRGNGLHHS